VAISDIAPSRRCCASTDAPIGSSGAAAFLRDQPALAFAFVPTYRFRQRGSADYTTVTAASYDYEDGIVVFDDVTAVNDETRPLGSTYRAVAPPENEGVDTIRWP
jgi:hypothetical protein